MLSMNTTTNLSNSSMNIEFIKYMKCVGVLVSLNDIIKYSYTPYLVENAILRDAFQTVLDLMITRTKFYLGENLSTG
jgi:hypothetical protein